MLLRKFSNKGSERPAMIEMQKMLSSANVCQVYSRLQVWLSSRTARKEIRRRITMGRIAMSKKGAGAIKRQEFEQEKKQCTNCRNIIFPNILFFFFIHVSFYQFLFCKLFSLVLSSHLLPTFGTDQLDVYLLYLLLVIGGSFCFNEGLSRSIFFSDVLEIFFRQVYCPLRFLLISRYM